MSECFVVHKFGGSCLRENSDIDKIANIIQSSDGKPVVVVSALWGVTDKLLRALKDVQYSGKIVQDLISQHLIFAPEIKDGPFFGLFQRVIDGISNEIMKLSSGGPRSQKSENLILASGERLSALVVAQKLRNLGIEANPIGAEDIGLIMKGSGKSKEIDLEKSKSSLKFDMLTGLPILTGWFGQGSDGELAILSRGGSDHSAAAFANLLNAKKLILWKDVDGIKPINPRWGIDTKSIPYLGYGQASELAIHGTNVIHPATLFPLVKLGIPVEINNIHEPKSIPPTIIGPDLNTQELIAIGCQPGVSLITDENTINSELISLIESKDVVPWHLESDNNSMKLILPNQFVRKYQKHFSGTIEHKSAIITIIGKHRKLGSNFQFVNKNDFGTRYLVTTNNLAIEIAELYYSLFSLQDCR